MNAPELLDTAIALAFTYMVLSLLATGLLESYSQAFKRRTLWLRKGINSLLTGNEAASPKSGIANDLLSHETIRSLSGNSLSILSGIRPAGPSYIPSETFARVLVSLLKEQTGTASSASAIANMAPSKLKERLTPIVAGAASEEELIVRVGDWFDDGMDRVTGWYRRRSQLCLLIVGLVLAVTLDINSIKLFTDLQSNETCRTALVAAAEATLNKSEAEKRAGFEKVVGSDDCKGVYTPDLNEWLKARSGQSTKAGLEPKCQVCLGAGEASECTNTCPLGVSFSVKSQPAADMSLLGQFFAVLEQRFASVTAAIGYLITAFAISLGAPFWMDGLKTLLSIRGAGPKPEKMSAKSRAGGPTANGTSSTPGNSPAQGNFETTLSSDAIKDLQTVLGMKISQVSGVIDALTRDKILHWQRQHGYPATGQLTNFDHAQMMAVP